MDPLSHFQRRSLGFFPTPVMELERLSDRLAGPRIYMKRDDQTGLAFGGNKTRKLEYLVGDALAREANTLVTGGAAQSNHCRQTAAAAKSCGLDCHLVLGGNAPEQVEGNLLLDQLFSAQIHWAGPNRKGETIPDIVAALEAQGRVPYLIPYGGSNAIGALGFVQAVSELQQQMAGSLADFSHIVFASSSGGTHAGLMAGAKLFGLQGEIMGIAIEKEEIGGLSLEHLIFDLSNEVAGVIGLDHHFSADEVSLETSYTGDGYGVVGDLERNAIRTLAEAEGVLVDPVYTGRAFGALLDMVSRGVFSSEDRVLFWHTGGAPAIFSYANEILV